MLVHFITDTPNKIPAVRAMLEPQHTIRSRVLGSVDQQALANGALVVDVDLRKTAAVEQLKRLMPDVQGVIGKFFVVQSQFHDAVAQAYALGATDVLSRASDVEPNLAKIELAQQRTKPDFAGVPPKIAKSAETFSLLFSTIGKDKQIAFVAERATAEVINGIKQNGLNAWLDDVRRYHEGTFQHCLLVTGVAVAFGLSIKFSDADVMRLGLAATLHDVGKTRIPLAILDKPGRLNQSEVEIMNRHPVIGFELLKPIPNMALEVLDAVRHHHEYLDGTGYPDGLTAPQISDIVRLLTISDVFAALVESRPYRPPMPRQDAYKVLCDMVGKLDGPLVKAFRSVAFKG